MTPKKVGGPKGKGPAKKTTVKRPPPPSSSSLDDDGLSIQDYYALLAKISTLEKQLGAAAPTVCTQPTPQVSKRDILNAILSRVSAVDAALSGQPTDMAVQPVQVAGDLGGTASSPEGILDGAQQAPSSQAPLPVTPASQVAELPATQGQAGASPTTSAASDSSPGTRQLLP
ncbi:uncharacterized protein LOC134297179 isoform X2 [Anolis carolinensis]|uniref:uncharacterized protein LOC134297179 isoform X2 n=1 Tax=Anolis carolinensis TaxID=28377 RepID=UPI002F2B8F74